MRRLLKRASWPAPSSIWTFLALLLWSQQRPDLRIPTNYRSDAAWIFSWALIESFTKRMQMFFFLFKLVQNPFKWMNSFIFSSKELFIDFVAAKEIFFRTQNFYFRSKFCWTSPVLVETESEAVSSRKWFPKYSSRFSFWSSEFPVMRGSGASAPS